MRGKAAPKLEYGERLLEKLSSDLTARFGRGFGLVQVRIMRQFFLAYSEIRQSPIDEFGASPVAPVIRQSAIEESSVSASELKVI